jgi:hypothetical protein
VAFGHLEPALFFWPKANPAHHPAVRQHGLTGDPGGQSTKQQHEAGQLVF